MARSYLRFLPWLGLLLACVACNDPREQRARLTVPQDRGEDDFAKAFELLDHLDEFEPQQATAQIVFHLNQWLAEQPRPQDWRPDPLVEGVPTDLRRGGEMDRLDSVQLNGNDVRFLQEAMWLRDIAAWAGSSPRASAIGPAADELLEQVPAPWADKLVTSLRLFDWTVRNIQQDELLDYPKREAAGTPGTLASARSSVPLPALAVPGPGYQFFPWQTLLFGRGDAWQRARVFILLARQRELDAVMLGFGDRRAPGRPRIWLTGVLLDEQLYLFDPRLGLPLPGADGRGVATLADVVATPALLRSLDLGDRFRYPVDEADLEQVVALVDASPQALALRMKIIERRMTGERRATLTVSPQTLAGRLRRLPAIGEVRLWNVPLETPLFQAALERLRGENPAVQASYLSQVGVFLGLNQLVQARHDHFQRRFEREVSQEGAKVRYMNIRVPQDEIERLLTDPDVQKKHGVERGRDEPENVWQNRLLLTQRFMAQGRLHASYWLALIHFENGNYRSAANWLRQRTLDEVPNGPWTNGARYNLARCYEALGELEQARQLYLIDESPQQHGNLLRARALRKVLDSRPPSPQHDAGPGEKGENATT